MGPDMARGPGRGDPPASAPVVAEGHLPAHPAPSPAPRRTSPRPRAVLFLSSRVRTEPGQSQTPARGHYRAHGGHVRFLPRVPAGSCWPRPARRRGRADARRPATPGRQSQDGGRRPRASGPWAPRTPRHLSSAPLSAGAGFLSLISNIPDGDTDLNHSGHNLLSKQPSNNSPRRPRAPSTWVTVCLHCDLSQTNTPNISCPCPVSPNVRVAQNTSLAHSLRRRPSPHPKTVSATPGGGGVRGNLPAAVSRPALLRGRCPQLLRPRLPVPRDFLRAACATGWGSQGQEAEARRPSGGGRGGRGSARREPSSVFKSICRR